MRMRKALPGNADGRYITSLEAVKTKSRLHAMEDSLEKQ